MKTKEEVIKEAWGRHYDSKNILTDGWQKKGDYINTIPCDCKEFHITYGDPEYYYRPKSLQGIENNHGWVRIEKDTIQYLTKGQYWVMYINGFIEVFEFEGTLQSIDYFELNFTHYQPIVKPNKPLY